MDHVQPSTISELFTVMTKVDSGTPKGLTLPGIGPAIRTSSVGHIIHFRCYSYWSQECRLIVSCSLCVAHLCVIGDVNVVEVRTPTFPGTATVGGTGVIVAVGDVAGEFSVFFFFSSFGNNEPVLMCTIHFSLNEELCSIYVLKL
jgi:hypothetical protein